MMWWGNDYWPMHGFFGPFMMIALIVLFAAMMVFIMRGMMMERHGQSNDRALAILKERFARGELTQAEYEERRRLLEV